jgi:FkbM family methyltransferase
MNRARLKAIARSRLSGSALAAARAAWHALERADPARLRRAWRHARLNRDAGADEIVIRDGVRLRIDPRSREGFEWFCFRSREMAEELDAFMADTRGCQRLLDVGAFHGIFSLVFAHERPDARCLALEPSPPAQEVLQVNLRLNANGRSSGLALALGEREGLLRMRSNWHHLEAVADAAGSEHDVRVPVRSLDALCAERGFSPDAIKIDVEGFEHAVLRGGQKLLSGTRPLLFLEIHPGRLRELGSSVAELLRPLEDMGYVFALSDGRGVRLRDCLAMEDVFRLRCRPR